MEIEISKKKSQEMKEFNIRKSVLLITLSTLILAVIIPVIDSKLRSVEFKIIESAIQVSDGNRYDNMAADTVNFSNYILASADLNKNKDLEKVFQLYRIQALKNRRFALAMRYLAINSKYPDKELEKRWAIMNLTQLEGEELNNPNYLRYDWRKDIKQKTFWLNFIKYLLYAIALSIYGKGLYQLNLIKK